MNYAFQLEFLFPTNLGKSHLLKDLHAVDKSTLFVNVKNWIIFISLGVILTSCKPLEKAASVRPLQFAGTIGKGVVFTIEHVNPIAMYKAAKEADPEHPPQDQMLIDLHNQLLAVRTDVKGVGEELGIEVNLPPLQPTLAESRQLVEQASAVSGLAAILALDKEPPPTPADFVKTQDLTETDLANLDRDRLRESGVAFLETETEIPFTGRAIDYHPNGEKKMQVTYWKGRAHGLLVRWHSNGKKNFEVEMNLNKAEGDATEWYPNGKKFRVTPMSDGHPHGKVTIWDDKGKVLSTQQYENGKLLVAPIEE